MSETIRIAIADDHQLIRTGISLILRSNPQFNVVFQASHGQELLDGIEEHKPHIVLLDLEMPIMSGRETLIKLRESYPNILVLVLTMHNEVAFIIQMMELGANGYLVKDTDPEEVVFAIKKVMKSQFYFSEQVSRAMLKGLANPASKNQESLTSHGLTSREKDVLILICQEYTTNEIGEKLFLSPKTIEGYRKLLMDKTNAKNMAGLVLFAVKHHLIDIDK